MERRGNKLNQKKSITLIVGLMVAILILISFNTFQPNYHQEPTVDTQGQAAANQEKSGDERSVISLEGLASIVQVTVSHFFTILFDVVFGESEKVYHDLEDMPLRLSYFKVLFSLIISPNAP